MSSIGDYYNENYAPIHDDYMAEQARIKLESSNLTKSTTEGMEMEQTTSREKRVSRYDEDNYALLDVDEESTPPTSSANDFPEVITSTPKTMAGSSNCSTWKWGTLACSTFVIVLVSGILVYFFTKPTSGNSLHCNIQTK